MLYAMHQTTLKLLVVKSGLNPDDFSSYSLDREGYMYLFICGASIEEICMPDDWSSDTVF